MKTTAATKAGGTSEKWVVTSDEIERIRARVSEIRGALEASSEASFETMRRWCWQAVDASEFALSRIEELEKELQAIVFGNLTARCPAWSVVDGVQRQCKLPNGHTGACQKVTLVALGGEE